jgi:cell division protein FtsW (lipid II flippase)/cell division protein FtsI/penicillin-binding protein 2
MGVTYTATVARDGRRAVAAARQFDAGHALFFATSLVCLMAIGMSYLGRVRTIPRDDEGRAPIVLSAAQNADTLEPALVEAFPSSPDRRFAAREIARFLAAQAEARQPLENVAAVLSIRVPAEAIDRANLVSFAERLRGARDAATAAGRPAPASIALLTTADLAAVKPRLAIRTEGAFRATLFRWLAAYILAFYGVLLLWHARGMEGDRVLLAAAHLLTALGFALLLSRADPLRDTLLIVRYTQGIVIGLALAAVMSWLVAAAPSITRFVYVPLAAAIALSGLLLVLGDGPGTSGAKVNLGPVQPIEAIRLLLALFLASFFARRWELLRQTRATAFRSRPMPSWLSMPKLDYVVPVVAGVAAALLMFFLQKDLGPALLLACVFLALYTVARGRWPMAGVGVAVLAAGFFLAYRFQLSSTLAGRVAMWRSPWDNAAPGGDQVSQSLWALASGGVFGTGLGLGDTRFIPAGHTDLILAAAGEELGLVGLVCIAATFAAIAWRGLRIAIQARDDHAFFLGTALTLFLVVPVLVMAAGILGAMPLTGVVTPFLSYGGSAMAANFTALGVLAGLRTPWLPEPRSAREDARSPFRRPMRLLAGTLGVAATALVLVLVAVQLVRADDLVVRPHLGRQADGIRRYQYNPRVLDVLRELPRGTIYDRTGLALATTDTRVAKEAATAYGKAGIDVARACLDLTSRCYPLSGETFHVIGDSSSRRNWSATNSAYVERDEEAALRGFDDHATSVAATSGQGERVALLRRDYREVVPLLRHRHQPDHPDAVAVRERNRDLRLTLDARLQHDVAGILARFSTRSKTGKAAAVVLDADSGHVLALLSHPWPSFPLDEGGADTAATAEDPFLDRARFGLYPPGSAFKLITATAALRRDLRLAQEEFTCSRLSDGRVGVRIRGGRPVRDDVLDRHAHGTIGMHRGLVHSCNAYFAQLAIKIGPEALLDTAARLGISVAAGGTPARLRDTLAQAGYGQGETLASPLRMARVVAAIASNGVLRDVSLLKRQEPAREELLLTPAAARVLARYMRDTVLSGTGRSLREHPARIAGKTGTAEIAHAPSHSWFVGFAPYGPATRRVAFAVIVENAGYGGQAAASLAGEVVASAARRGLVE